MDVLQAKCPTGKIRFFLRADADAALRSLIADATEHPARLARLHVYLAPCCGSWHIGHNFRPFQKRTSRRGKHRRPTTSPNQS